MDFSKPLRIQKFYISLLISAVLSSLGGLASANFSGDVVLGSPTDRTITFSLLSRFSEDIYINYGIEPGRYTRQSPLIFLTKNEPKEVTISDLLPNTRYYYQLLISDGMDVYPVTEEQSFHTARSAGSTFSFGVQGDSHPERAPRDFVPELYDVTLNQAKRDGVDLYFTAGDDFSIDRNYPEGITKEDVIERYRIQRPHLGVVGSSAPVFLVNGNHEQGALYLYNDARKYPAPENPAVWVQNARNAYFPQPEPNHFYTGNEEQLEYIDKGLKGTYFAFEWGDALFVILDPFWSSEAPVDNLFEGPRGEAGEAVKTPDKWDISLGDKQYNWLKETLETSDAAHKFVFSHMLHGINRGGVERLNLFEWGGENVRGRYQFDSERSNWDKPLHQLLVDTGVSIYFHAHDHVWVKQELDGVIYQELSSPADPDYELSNWSRAYTDESSVILPNTGYTRVTVSPEEVKVDYIRTYLPEDETDERKTGDIAYSYTIKTSE